MSQICENSAIQAAEQQAADEFVRLHEINKFQLGNLGPSLTEEIIENGNAAQVRDSDELEYEC